MPVKGLIRRLHEHLDYMSDLAEKQLDTAVMALVDGNAQLAQETLAAEEEMDAMDLQVNNLAQEALETLKPDKEDFRYVVAGMRAASCLAQIGDLAADTARQAVGMGDVDSAPAGEELSTLVEAAETLVRDAVGALVSGDTDRAWAVIEREGDTGMLQEKAVNAIEGAMEKGNPSPKRAVYLLLAAVDLGRITERAVSIAEEVIYMVENRLIRHVGRMMLDAKQRGEFDDGSSREV